MVTIMYREYYNDYRQSTKTASFYSLKELQNWIFDKRKGGDNYGLFFTDPDKNDVNRLQSNGSISVWDKSTGASYWVNTISIDGGIIYSDGYNTSGVKYWNETAKQFLRDCIVRKNNPASAYNFI